MFYFKEYRFITSLFSPSLFSFEFVVLKIYLSVILQYWVSMFLSESYLISKAPTSFCVTKFFLSLFAVATCHIAVYSSEENSVKLSVELLHDKQHVDVCDWVGEWPCKEEDGSAVDDIYDLIFSSFPLYFRVMIFILFSVNFLSTPARQPRYLLLRYTRNSDFVELLMFCLILF